MFVNPCNYTLEVDDSEYGTGRPIGEVSAFDPDVIEEEGQDKGDGAADVSGRDELKKLVESGDHVIDQSVVKSELVLAFRDKKQLKREKKFKLHQS